MSDAATGERDDRDEGAEYGTSAARDARTAGERRFWRWTAVGLGAIAFGKGIREPNAWPYTHAQLNYSAGFIRRGLYGAALGHPLGLHLYGHYVVVSTVLWANPLNPYIWIVLAVTLGFGFVGFYDDYLKVTRQTHAGLFFH